MIERLELFNFQRYAQLCLDLAAGVTCLVGPSDCGKSSSFRGLRWVATNQPAGEALARMRPVRSGCAFVKARLTLDGGRTVVRRRGQAGNHYLLDGKVYEAFRNDVPEPVAGLLRLDAGNFAGQHDLAFLFSETPGAASRALNGVVDLELIDRVLDGVAGRVRTAQAAHKAAAARHAAANAEAAALAWVPAFQARVKALEAAAARQAAARQKAARLGTILQEVAQAAARRDRALYANLALAKAVAVGERAARARARAGHLGKLLDVIRQINTVLNKRTPDLRPLEAAAARVREARGRWQTLADRLTQVRAARATASHLAGAAGSSESALSALKAALRTCPACGGSLA